MDLFNSLPLKKQEYMNRLFRNCTEEVKYYMSVIDVEADQTFIKAREECKYIYIILSGKVTGVEWPMHEKSYSQNEILNSTVRLCGGIYSNTVDIYYFI